MPDLKIVQLHSILILDIATLTQTSTSCTLFRTQIKGNMNGNKVQYTEYSKEHE